MRFPQPAGAALPLISLVTAIAVSTVTACSGPAPRTGNHVHRNVSVAGITTAENARPGDPHWRITRPGPLYQLEGYTDRSDVLPGGGFRLFVSTTAPSFVVHAFRMGWYGGTEARLVWTSAPIRGQEQPGQKLVQPGNLVTAPWHPSAAIATTNWPPGSYLLRLDASTGIQAYVPFVVRSPSTTGRIALISAVTSYQAYNGWGRYSLYGGPGGLFADRGRRVTFDRPLSYNHGAGAYFQLELPLVVLAERLDLPLAYVTSVDLDMFPQVLDGARAVVSEAHDEYWSPAMRDTLTRARDHGVNIAFFGANAIFRKIRFESSPLGPDRIEVNYKVPQEDPRYGKNNALVTGNWPTYPDPDPESSLIGESYVCSVTSNYPMRVTDPRSWIWAGAGVRPDEELPGLVGPEFDQVNPNEPTPHPIEVIARTLVNCGAPATYADAAYYVASSGAGVFDSGTEDWICALPGADCGVPGLTEPRVQRAVVAATSNVLRAFAKGPAGREHPAPELIPSSDGRPPLLGIS